MVRRLIIAVAPVVSPCASHSARAMPIRGEGQSRSASIPGVYINMITYQRLAIFLTDKNGGAAAAATGIHLSAHVAGVEKLPTMPEKSTDQPPGKKMEVRHVPPRILFLLV